MTCLELQPRVIYPYGPLARLLPGKKAHRSAVYVLEFEHGLLKVGVSKVLRQRLEEVRHQGEAKGWTPKRFLFTEQVLNARELEAAAINELSTLAQPSPIGAEWFEAAALSDVINVLMSWQAVQAGPNQPVFMPTSALHDMRISEQRGAFLGLTPAAR